MNDFFDKEDYSEEDIHNLIESKIEESIHLDFKASGALGTSSSQKKEIAKDVSSFANSDGGIIIYGIKEQNHVADSISFIDGTQYTKEWIEQIIQTNISRRIQGIKIFPIRFGNDVVKSVYLIKIPASTQAPHMINGGRYYRRFNFESVRMEEYEVRNLYNRLQKTELTINGISIRRGSISGSRASYEYVEFHITMTIYNQSNAIENQYKAEFQIPKPLIKNDLRAAGFQQYLNFSTEEHHIYSLSNRDPIFQGEEVALSPITIRVEKETFSHSENFQLNTKLYFSNGVQEKTFDLRPYLEIDGINIDESSFRDRG